MGINRWNRDNLQLIAIMLVGLILIPRLMTAQTTTATILGAVHDESGAVLPNVTVTVTNVDTGVSRTGTTGQDGKYRIPELPLGNYEAQAQQTGFQREVRKGITLTVGREAVVDLTLQVGSVSESISVTADAPLVETTSSSVSNLVDAKSIETLPLNGRDLTQLAILQPGVVLTTTSASSTTAGPEKKVSIAGSRPNQGTFLLDGMDIINNTGKGVSGVSGQLLGIDSIREFNVLTSNYSAQYGRSAGGIINMVTKSGTNTLHGSAVEYLRNDNFDARGFFDQQKPEFRRNQFGASMGGRMVRDKSFFFGSYEGFRESLGTTSIGFVPTADARVGRIGNQTITVDPRVKPLLDVFPLPNAQTFSDGTGQFVSAEPQVTSENYVMGRMDYYITPKDSFFGRYTIDDGTETLPYYGSTVPGFGLPLKLRGQYVTLQETRIFTQHLVNVARLGVNRTHYSGATKVVNPALTFYPDRSLGQVATTGLALVGGGTNQPFDHPVMVIDYADDVNWNQGSHALKMGFLGRKYLWGFQRDFRLNGVLTFNGLQNLLTNTPVSFTGILPGSADTRRHYRQNMYGFYIQDDARLRNNFTLNVGLRYEFITNPTEDTGPRLAYIPQDWMTTKPVNGILTNRIFKENPSLKNFSPRIGFAWDIFGDGKTALRGGWAFVFDQIYPLYYENQRIPPLSLTVDVRNNIPYPNPLAGLVNAVAPLSPTAMDYFNKKTPTVMQMNLSIQRELIPATVVTLAYIGSRNLHLPLANDVNTSIPTFQSDGRVFFAASSPVLNPNWGRTSILEWTGQGFYNSFVVSANRRWGKGLQVNGNYTWSRNVDEGSNTIGGDFSNTSRQRQDPYHKNGDRGLASMHIAHAFNTSYVLDLPFGPGMRFANGATGAAGKLIQGWQLQGIISGNSGPPFSVDIGSVDRSRSANLADRPDLKPGRSNNPIVGSPNRYFDTSAFVLQTPGYFGNLGRDTLIGPGKLTFDFSLIKNTPLRERLNLQFRSEFFNLLNRANFGIPGRTVFTANGAIPAAAGIITTTVTSGRQIQFGLKLLF